MDDKRTNSHLLEYNLKRNWKAKSNYRKKNKSYRALRHENNPRDI